MASAVGGGMDRPGVDFRKRLRGELDHGLGDWALLGGIDPGLQGLRAAARARVEAWELRRFCREGRLVEALVDSASTGLAEGHDRVQSLDFTYPDPQGGRIRCAVLTQTHAGDPVATGHYRGLVAGASLLVCQDRENPQVYYEDPYLHLVGRLRQRGLKAAIPGQASAAGLDLTFEPLDGLAGGLVLKAAGYIDRTNCSFFADRILEGLAGGYGRLVLDLSGTSFIWDAFLAFFPSLKGFLGLMGGGLAMLGLQARVQDALALSGLDAYLDMLEGPGEALPFFARLAKEAGQDPWPEFRSLDRQVGEILPRS